MKTASFVALFCCWSAAHASAAPYQPQTPAARSLALSLPPLLGTLSPYGRIVVERYLREPEASPVDFRRDLGAVAQSPFAPGEFAPLMDGLDSDARREMQAAMDGVAFKADSHEFDLTGLAKKIFVLHEVLRTRFAPYDPEAVGALAQSLHLLYDQLGAEAATRTKKEISEIARRLNADAAALSAGKIPPPPQETGMAGPAARAIALVPARRLIQAGDAVVFPLLRHPRGLTDEKFEEARSFFAKGPVLVREKSGDIAHLVNMANEKLSLESRWLALPPRKGDWVRLDPAAQVSGSVRDFFSRSPWVRLGSTMPTGEVVVEDMSGRKQMTSLDALFEAPRLGDSVAVFTPEGRDAFPTWNARLRAVYVGRFSGAENRAMALLDSGLRVPLDRVRRKP